MVVSPFVGKKQAEILVVLLCPSPTASNLHSASNNANTGSSNRTISVLSKLNGGTIDNLVVTDAFPYKRSKLNKDGSKGKNISVSVLDIDFAKWWISSLISHFGVIFC